MSRLKFVADVAETENTAFVFEVSAFGGFRGGKEGLNQDVAELYVDHVLTTLEYKESDESVTEFATSSEASNLSRLTR